MALSNKMIDTPLEKMPKFMGMRKGVLVHGEDSNDGFCRTQFSKNKKKSSRIKKAGKINKKSKR